MLEYVLLAGINDTQEDAERLSKFANRVGCKVNVIPFNETPALANANKGIIPKATYGLIACSILIKSEKSFSFFL